MPRKRSRYESENAADDDDDDGDRIPPRDRAREGRYSKYINECCARFGDLSKRIYSDVARARGTEGKAAAFRLAAALEIEAAAIARENLAETPAEIAHILGEKRSPTAAATTILDGEWLRACGLSAKVSRGSPWRTWNSGASSPHCIVSIESLRI